MITKNVYEGGIEWNLGKHTGMLQRLGLGLGLRVRLLLHLIIASLPSMTEFLIRVHPCFTCVIKLELVARLLSASLAMRHGAVAVAVSIGQREPISVFSVPLQLGENF